MTVIQWTGAPTTTDATNTVTTNEVVTFTSTVVVLLGDTLPDEDERMYQTFREGCEFRLERWHIHPWIMNGIPRLAPPTMRPRRTEVAGFSRRWTSGFK